MELIDIDSWKRKQHFEHFSLLKDPYFGVVIPFDVTKSYESAKKENISFFCKYLHDCMLAINDLESFKLRVKDKKVEKYEVIHASPTIMRADTTFGFSFVVFDEDIRIFQKNLNQEKERIMKSRDLFPPINSLDCIHCSALPWFNFTGHKEPVSGQMDSVPKLAFSRAVSLNKKLMMNISINVNHALVDGHDVGLFAEKLQNNFNNL